MYQNPKTPKPQNPSSVGYIFSIVIYIKSKMGCGCSKAADDGDGKSNKKKKSSKKSKKGEPKSGRYPDYNLRVVVCGASGVGKMVLLNGLMNKGGDQEWLSAARHYKRGAVEEFLPKDPIAN